MSDDILKRCATCESPVLCTVCLHNRRVVDELRHERDRLLTTLRTIPGYPDTPLHPGPWWPEAALNSAEAEAAKWRDERNAFLRAMVKAQSALRKYGAHRTVDRIEHGAILCPADPRHASRGGSLRPCECGLDAALKGDSDGE